MKRSLSPQLEGVLQQGLGHHQAGRLAEAETCYRQVLAAAPDHPFALNFLGVVASQVGRHDVGMDLFRKAIASQPNVPEFHNNLGLALQALGKPEEAEASYRQAIRLNRAFPEAHNNLGTVLQDEGRLDEAGKAFEKAIQLKPDYAEANFNAGNVLLRQDDAKGALKRFERAIRLRPGYYKAYCGLGLALKSIGNPDDAEQAYVQAINLQPAYAEAHSNYAALLRERGRLDEAEAAYLKSLDLNPTCAESWNGLGELYQVSGRLNDAEERFRRAIALKPSYAVAHNNLGLVLAKTGRLEDAMTSYQAALRHQPDYVQALNNLGILYADLGRLDEAAHCYQEALALAPAFATARTNLGNVYREQGQLDNAKQCYLQSLQINPDQSVTQNNLATILMAEGRVDEARVAFQRAMKLDPAYAVAHSNLIFMMDFDPAMTVEMQQAERRKWNALHAVPLKSSWRSHENDRNPNRKLRIGYVSADFRMHSAAYAFEPLLCFYDREAFEVFCYSNSPRNDPVTQKFRQSVDHWREVYGVDDVQLERLVRQDNIDILVDLSGHSAGNRLLVFARKPAPIQVTGWGHANGTGLDAMDYLVSDPVSIPAQDRPCYAEEIIELPCQISYSAPSDSPPVSSLPAEKNGFLTFGCFNRLAKMTEANFSLWAKILKAVPDSRLMLKAKELSDASRQAWVCECFAGHGVGSERLILAGRTTWYEHMQHFREVDIALDTFPYGGGVSTYEALWMGCPVVALRGQTLTGRIAAAIETGLGMEDWVADDEAAYIRLAIAKTRNLDALNTLRQTLRTRLQESSLGNPKKYVALLELAYRRVWQKWCEGV